MDVSPIDVPSPFPLGAKQASSLRRTRNLPVPYLLEREVYLPVFCLGLGLGAKSYLFGFVSKAVTIMGGLKYHLRQKKGPPKYCSAVSQTLPSSLFTGSGHLRPDKE